MLLTLSYDGFMLSRAAGGQTWFFPGYMEGPSDGSVWAWGTETPMLLSHATGSLPQWPPPGLPPPLPVRVHPFAARTAHSDKPLPFFGN